MTGRVFKISADIVWHVPWMLPCYHPIEHNNFLETTKYLESMHIYIYIHTLDLTPHPETVNTRIISIFSSQSLQTFIFLLLLGVR